jgi:hypothetical protein
MESAILCDIVQTLPHWLVPALTLGLTAVSPSETCEGQELLGVLVLDWRLTLEVLT